MRFEGDTSMYWCSKAKIFFLAKCMSQGKHMFETSASWGGIWIGYMIYHRLKWSTYLSIYLYAIRKISAFLHVF